jgi:hypothetical protein
MRSAVALRGGPSSYFHGFSASRKDITPVVETLAGMLHANTFLTRLSAQGTDTGSYPGRRT